MATTIPYAALVPVAPIFTNPEQLAVAGLLAGYSGLTRQAYELDLRQYAAWCRHHQLHLFQARRADIELFARDLEARGRARATITRRLCTVAGFYRYAVEEELLEHSPAAHVRRPRLDYESRSAGQVNMPRRRRRLAARPSRLRHSQLSVAYQDDALTLEITNSGSAGRNAGGGNGGPAAGHGITGMRERVGMYGGQFRAAPLPGRGFRVKAVFPLAGTGA